MGTRVMLGEYPQPPRDVSVDGARREQGFYRRDVVIALGVGLLAGVGEVIAGVPTLRRAAVKMLIEGLSPDQAESLPDDPAELVAVEGTATESRPEDQPYIAPWIGVPGLGVKDGMGVSNVVKNEVLGNAAKWTEVYGIVYPEKGIVIDEFAAQINRVARRHGRLNAAVESAGLLVFLAALNRANELNVEHNEPVIKLDSLAVVSSPLGLEYVEPRKREGVRFVAEYDIDGDELVELVYKEVMRRRTRPNDDIGNYDVPGLAGKALDWLIDLLQNGFEDGGNYVPPEVLIDCMKLIYRLRATLLLNSLAEMGVFTQRTRIDYFMAPPGMDDLVLAEKACRDLGACAAQLGVPFGQYVFQGRHADTPAALKIFGEVYRQRIAAAWKRQKAAENSAAQLPKPGAL